MSNSKSTSITVRIDEDLKKNFEEVLDDIGLSISSAFTVFAKAVTKERKIPFELKADKAEFQERLDDFNNNRNIVHKTLSELKEMEK